MRILPARTAYSSTFLWLLLFLLLVFILSLSLGSVAIPPQEVWKALIGQETSQIPWKFIITEFRLPKALAAVLTGMALSVSGLMMQTLFRNPLAGPFVLGISSGASLGVALLLMGGSLLGGIFNLISHHDLGLALASSTGSLLVLLSIAAMAWRVRDSMALLIIGLMFSSITSALVGLLSFFSTAQELKQYTFWAFGNLGNIGWQELSFFSIMIFSGLLISLYTLKTLNALLLGESYAMSLGIPMKKMRILIILSTSILAGTVTAFAGPIAFIGLAVPHICRLLFKTSDHLILLPGCIILGALLMLSCDFIAQWPLDDRTLPVNAITSILGAPVVIWLLLRRRKLLF